MLSFVLPLVAIAIALTPVVASASAVYKRETDEQSDRFSGIESNFIDHVERPDQAERLVASLGRR